MEPKSLSASSLLVSEACLERWKLENYQHIRGGNSYPAMIGTTFHSAAEMFVKYVYIDQNSTWDNVSLLNDLTKIAYTQTFGNTNYDTEAFQEVASLVSRWYDRNREGLPDKVLSVEVKENFPVKTSIGKIPFNYIYDRFDQVDEHVYRVVDYKTWRSPKRPEDLKDAIQPRAYALAAQIKYPDAERIWVVYDQIRFDEVGTVFSKEDSRETYNYIKKAAERIISTPEDQTEETLNPECKWCIKKTTCETLLQVAPHTPLGMDLDALTHRRLEIQSQLEGLKWAASELDEAIMKEAEVRDEYEFDTNSAHVAFTARGTRKVNSAAVARIVGPEVTAKWGNFTITNVDKMLKSGELDDAQVRQIKEEITVSYGEPTLKIKPLSGFSS